MGNLRDAYNETVKANRQADPKVDAALVEAGRAIANEIDFAVDNLEGQERTKALYLMPHLMNILREMHATPEARRVAGLAIVKENSGGSKVGKFRSVAGGKAS